MQQYPQQHQYHLMCQHIIQNNHLLPAAYQSYSIQLCNYFISNQQDSKDDTFIAQCCIWTFWCCLVPQLQSICCDFNYAYEVKYPIVVVLSFIEKKESCSCIDMKLVQWIQSGGTRVVPLSINTEGYQKILDNCHGIIIPSCNKKHASNIELIYKVIIELKTRSSVKPILALGTSASYVITCEKQCQLPAISEQQNQLQIVYIKTNNLFKNVQINTKIIIQHQPKVKPFPSRIISSQFRANQEWSIDGIIRNKNNKLCTIYSMHHTNKPIFLWYDQPQLFITPQSITLSHQLITNFIDLCRVHPYKIQEPKKLISHYQLIFTQLQSYYQIP